MDALTCAGFTLRSRAGDAAVMTKDLRVVEVPDAVMLTPEELLRILRSAGVPYSDFLDLLSEAPTDPAISRTRLAPRSAMR